jgi:hypothetical protein
MIVFEFLKGIVVTVLVKYAILVTFVSLFIYLIFMLVTIGVFVRGFFMFRSKMTVNTTSKSGGGVNVVEVFMKRANTLATALGINLFLGVVMLVLFVGGGKEHPATYVIFNGIGEDCFAFASLAQTLFVAGKVISY